MDWEKFDLPLRRWLFAQKDRSLPKPATHDQTDALAEPRLCVRSLRRLAYLFHREMRQFHRSRKSDLIATFPGRVQWWDENYEVNVSTGVDFAYGRTDQQAALSFWPKERGLSPIDKGCPREQFGISDRQMGLKHLQVARQSHCTDNVPGDRSSDRSWESQTYLVSYQKERMTLQRTISHRLFFKPAYGGVENEGRQIS